MGEPACNTSNLTHEEASWEVQKTTALQGKGATEALMGLDLLTQLGLTIHPATGEVFAVEHGPVTTQLCALPAIKGYQHKIVLKADATPLVFEKASRPITAFITHEGLFLFKRVPFELASAGAAFQKLLDRLLAGIPGCQQYLDDILCTGRTQQEHGKRLMLFIPRYASAVSSMGQPLENDMPLKWTSEVDQEFMALKRKISTCPTLMAYNPQLFTIVTTDVSDKGIGVVLSQMDDSEKEQAVLYSGRAGDRVARWQARLIPYSYEVEYVPRSRLPGADALSRFPVTENIEEGKEEYEIVALLDDETAITQQETEEVASADEHKLPASSVNK
ncbi:hypothetical protein O3P69_009809 [Scylla paramamosain]|uniref:Reverse transcriptase/retrotransposon-derived protein RNase H-like domain-containing protein n=1 Tax=Scylla paramamosain TaxID=85552 RepID=A0AAW0SQJ3_SCYPA